MHTARGRLTAETSSLRGGVSAIAARTHLKVVVTTGTVIAARSQATGLETEYQSHKGKDRFDRAFLAGVYHRAQRGCHASPQFPKGTRDGVCSLAQKRWFVYFLDMMISVSWRCKQNTKQLG